MNSTQLLNSIETIEQYANLAYRKCRFIIDGTFDDDEKSKLLEILKEIESLSKNAIENLESKNQSNHG